MDAVADAEGAPKGDRRKRSQSIRTLRNSSLDSRFRGNDEQERVEPETHRIGL
ncbi:hypothetical protein RLIN73S_01944 [Rhodanobacter lindaniclasticus]